MHLKIDEPNAHVRIAQNGRLSVLIDQPPSEEHGYYKIEYFPDGLKLTQALQLLGTQPRVGPVSKEEKRGLLDILFGPTTSKPA